MGILNVSPESFSGDGLRPGALDDARRRAWELVAQGADLVDVGGQTAQATVPSITVQEEIDRVVPVVERLACELPVPISVDTFRLPVAQAAVAAGAALINDIGGMNDAGMIDLAAASGTPLVLMHIRGRPKEILYDPPYADVVAEVSSFFEERVNRAIRAGLSRDRILLDIGIGFKKQIPDQLELIHRLAEFRQLGFPILFCPSRKRIISQVLGGSIQERDDGTAGLIAWGVVQGANIIRVHDVRAATRVARMVYAVSLGKRYREPDHQLSS